MPLQDLADKLFACCRWEERWEHLQLILEVYQFARDAAVAEAWLIAQVMLCPILGNVVSPAMTMEFCDD
jgi:hypothetical protein